MKNNMSNKLKLVEKYNEKETSSLEYYGISMKNGRARIDAKRFEKFFPIPDKKIEHRNTVYYVPSKIHSHDYVCNVFNR